jgi:hypothetical protein
VVILVEVDGKEVVMIFITNNTERAASNIGELYQARWQGQAADWSHSFSRLLTVVRGVVRDKIDLAALLKSYGTAGGIYRMRTCCEGTYLPGFTPQGYGTACGRN